VGWSGLLGGHLELVLLSHHLLPPPKTNPHPPQPPPPRFQGIAISCLRTAFQRSRDARARRDLARPSAWSDVCDGAASTADVSNNCRAATRLLKAHAAVRAGDTPKLQLRRLWYQMLESGYMSGGRVYGGCWGLLLLPLSAALLESRHVKPSHVAHHSTP
jgi:hypothetical protein